jgi:hypothetical protein
MNRAVRDTPVRPSSFPASRALALAACIAAACAPYARAEDVTAPTLKTRLVSISLFKNGLGFVTREAELPKGGGVSLVPGLPAPALGTFWLYSDADAAAVRDAVAFVSETTERVDAISVDEMIQANVGQTVELRLGDKETIRAKIVSASLARPADTPQEMERIAYPPSPQFSSLLLLQTGNGMIAVNRGAIQQISSVSGPLKTTIERPRRAVSLRLRTSPSGKGRLIVQYLAKGLAWAPSYAIDITDPNKARVTAKAEIIDEIEDMDDVAVSLITGFPNLRFADVTDPMALRSDLAAFLNNAGAPGRLDDLRGRGGVFAQQSVLANAAEADEGLFPTYSSTPGEGQTREELFFYEQKGVTLKKGERGYYPLFSVEASYEHLYEWKIGDALDEQEQYRSRSEAGPEPAEDVWHGIRLTNTGTVPWTTAPAMTMQGGQILGQDVMHYTSTGGKSTVRITKAVDIKAERAEFETERTRNAANFYGYSYDLVEVHGKLKATNFKDKPVTLTITKELSGEVLRSTPAAKVDQTAKRLKKVNPKSVLTWEIPIKARDKVEIEYSYKVYVRD